MDVERFRETPFLGILRGIRSEAIEPLVEAVASTRVPALEITMNTEGAPALIRLMVAAARGRIDVGAGTVLTAADVDAALAAGATFIVSPVLVPEVVATCIRLGVPVFPGGFTPQEVYACHLAGATMVKVFPTGAAGPAHIKELTGPFDEIDLLACGGVRPSNVAEFFAAGASAVAFGGSLFDSARLEAGAFDEIVADIEALLASR